MTPTPREDTMAEQTEQDVTRLVMARLLDVLRDNFDDNNGRTHFDECWRAHAPCAVRKAHDLLSESAAQVREQIAHLIKERDAAQHEAIRLTLAFDTLRAERDYAIAEVERQKALVLAQTLLGCEFARERDAAQQQIATITEALDAEIAVLEQEARDRMQAERDAEQAGSPERANYSKGRRLATELCVSRLYALKRAALQSTRPQEQP